MHQCCSPAFGKKQEVSNCDSSGISHYTRNHDPISLLRLLLLWNWSLRSSQAPWSTLAAETTSGTFQVTISVSEAGNRMARPNIAHHIESNQPKVTTTNEDPAYIGMALNWHTSEVFNLANHGNLCFMAQNLASSCWEASLSCQVVLARQTIIQLEGNSSVQTNATRYLVWNQDDPKYFGWNPIVYYTQFHPAVSSFTVSVLGRWQIKTRYAVCFQHI